MPTSAQQCVTVSTFSLVQKYIYTCMYVYMCKIQSASSVVVNPSSGYCIDFSVWIGFVAEDSYCQFVARHVTLKKINTTSRLYEPEQDLRAVLKCRR